MPRRCSLCATGIDVTPLSGESERATAKRLGVKRSTLKRHLPHARTALVVVSEAVVECCKTCGHSPDADEDVNARMIRDARRLFAKAESAGDIRGAVVAHRELRDALRFIQELIGIGSETEPPVLVSFSFPDSGLHTSDPNKSPFENAADSWQRGAATRLTSLGPDSAIPENAVPTQGNVEPEERQVEEIVAAQAKARDFSIWKAAGVAPAAEDGTDE